MYGRAEQVIGDIATKLDLHHALFLATKVWTTGKQEGIDSMEKSLAKLQVKRIDLMQVHNLVDVRTHLATLRDWKQKGHARYLGITHHVSNAHGEVANILRTEKLDFVQINYSLLEREAGEQILPLARDRGVAVIVNRPFGGGELFARVRQKPLPEWATEFDCLSWTQFLLKWIIAHPAVTCAIPATNKAHHLEDNRRASDPFPMRTCASACSRQFQSCNSSWNPTGGQNVRSTGQARCLCYGRGAHDGLRNSGLRPD